MDKNNFDWKKIGIVAAIIWVFSLPVAIWRSSHIGKLIYLALLLVILSKCIAPITNIYFNITALSSARSELKPILKNIELLKDKNKELTEWISNSERQFDKITDEKLKGIDSAISQKVESVNKALDEAEKNIDLIKESERDSLKERIIRIREDVVVRKKSIESADIRIQCEFLAKKLYLLTPDEKQRFLDDLKKIGFQTEELEDNAVRIYNQGYSIMSMDSASYGYILVNPNQNRRRNQYEQ